MCNFGHFGFAACQSDERCGIGCENRNRRLSVVHGHLVLGLHMGDGERIDGPHLHNRHTCYREVRMIPCRRNVNKRSFVNVLACSFSCLRA